MANTTLYTAVTGIVVSGVAGPMASAWASRRASRQQFDRDIASHHRDDLRALVDHAAELLSAGATYLRLAAEADQTGESSPAEVGEWAGEVYVLEQRLLLRLPATHPVVAAYVEVRNSLIELGTAALVEDAESSINAFEEARSTFLDRTREALNAPVAEDEAT
jgi:hypothetical protein